MSRIRVLPEEVSNRIAAGEVIERPASVVKELVDNALDAGATRIRVAIEAGGRNLVAVTDDGCGMDAEDALMCLEAHATSKLRQAEDLVAIDTLGFRGEAMPSIASVSRFQLRTRVRDADSGTEVLVNGGTIEGVKPVGCAPGTSVYVRKLFYNLPARRKFLRTVPTEEAHIEEMVMSQALAHPKIGFDLDFDGRSIISVHAGSDLRTRTAMLIGKDVVENMVEVKYGGDGVDVWGFIARPGITRASRREQRTFVNGRPVASDTLYHGIREAYHTLVSKGRYPPVVLFLSVDPTGVDVNVHPAKREVRFHDGRGVGRIVTAALEQALRHQMTGGIGERLPALTTPKLGGAPVVPTADDREAIGPAIAPPPLVTAPLPQLPAVQQVLPISHDRAASVAVVAPETAGEVVAVSEPAAAASDARLGDRAAGDVLDLRLVGELGDRYLVAEGPRGLVMIDRRAAHERILFEQLLATAEQDGGAGQGLLIPVTLSFGASEADLLRRNVDRLVELGFDLSDFGGNSFLLSAVPAHFPQENLAAMMREMVDLLRQESGRRLDRRRLAQLAGSAALQAQDRLDDLEKEKLLENLAATELPYVCPKGKPTIITIPHSELSRRFGRR